jgi:hypothetical protein
MQGKELLQTLGHPGTGFGYSTGTESATTTALIAGIMGYYQYSLSILNSKSSHYLITILILILELTLSEAGYQIYSTLFV